MERKYFLSMYFVERVQSQGKLQRKIGLSKKFWQEFPIGAMVKISLVNDEELFYVDKVQAQGKIQRRIPLPHKFWPEFAIGEFVKVELMRK